MKKSVQMATMIFVGGILLSGARISAQYTQQGDTAGIDSYNLKLERGISVLFTEHSMDVVFAYADRILVLARGMLIADGTAESIRDNPEVQQVYLGTGKTYAGAAR